MRQLPDNLTLKVAEHGLRPRTWAIAFAVFTVVALVVMLKPILYFLTEVAASVAGGPPYDASLLVDALNPIIVVLLYAASSGWLIRRDRRYWQAGAKFPVVSVDEARIVLNLSNAEYLAYAKQRGNRLARELFVAAAIVVHVVLAATYFIATDNVRWSIMISIVPLFFYLPFLPSAKKGRRADLDLLSKTSYATRNGIRRNDLAESLWLGRAIATREPFEVVLYDDKESPFN